MMMAGGGGASASGFFGAIGMRREFWAEDPDWSDPGDGNDMGTWRDNGALAENIGAGTASGGALPKFFDSLINGLPGVDFAATTNTSGGYVRTSAGTTDPPLTVGAVARVDVINGTINAPYIMDALHSSVFAAIGALNSGSQWTAYHVAGLNANGGTWDANPHLFILRIATNDLDLYVDGSIVASDSSGTASTVTGITLGADRAAGGSMLDGAVSYAFHYEGDLISDPGYSDWYDAIIDYYGI
jgi:hypothetical protein